MTQHPGDGDVGLNPLATIARGDLLCDYDNPVKTLDSDSSKCTQIYTGWGSRGLAAQVKTLRPCGVLPVRQEGGEGFGRGGEGHSPRGTVSARSTAGVAGAAG